MATKKPADKPEQITTFAQAVQAALATEQAGPSEPDSED